MPKPSPSPKESIVLGNAIVQGNRVITTISLPLITQEAAPDGASIVPLMTADNDRATHAPDFSSVNWFGTVYTFSPMQASIVADLWRAWEDGYDFVGQQSLLEEAGSDCHRIRDLFVGHPAFGTMIVQAKFKSKDARAGQYCLNVPSKF